MRGNDKVMVLLNEGLQGELTAIVEYIVHSEMCENWGYHRLGAYIKKQAIEEMGHAEGLIERILFLEGTPKVDGIPGPKIGGTVKAQLENDLGGELKTIDLYNAAIKTCSQAGDNVSKVLFEKMLNDEERHADFLETQLSIIRDTGLENYLTQQMHAGK